jgi:hypothetical protein
VTTPTKIRTSACDLAGSIPGATRFLACTVLAWALILTLAVDASAQLQGPPTAPAATGGQPWSLSLSEGELFESESAQLGTPGGSAVPGSQLGSQLSGSLARGWVFPRGSLTVTGNVSQLFYNQNTAGSDLNQFMYGFGFSGSYAISRRLRWTVADTLSSAYARDTTVLVDAALLPPKALTRYNTASTGLTYDLAPRTHLNWGFSEQNFSVASSQSTNSSEIAQFPSTSTLGTSIGISQQISRSQSIGVVANYSRTFGNGISESIAGLSATWQVPIGTKLTVTAAGGAYATTLPGQSALQIDPTGTIGIGFNSATHLLFPNDTFGVSLGRALSPELGIGSLLTQGVSATYGVSFGPRLTITGTGSLVSGADALDPNRTLLGRTGSVSVRYLLARGVGVAVAYGVFVRPPTDSDHYASLSLTYGKAWR